LEVANRVCQGKILSALEGGYNVSALSRSVLAHVEGLVEEPRGIEEDEKEGVKAIGQDVDEDEDEDEDVDEGDSNEGDDEGPCTIVCPVCTLVNDAKSRKCVVCDGRLHTPMRTLQKVPPSKDSIGVEALFGNTAMRPQTLNSDISTVKTQVKPQATKPQATKPQATKPQVKPESYGKEKRQGSAGAFKIGPCKSVTGSKNGEARKLSLNDTKNGEQNSAKKRPNSVVHCGDKDTAVKRPTQKGSTKRLPNKVVSVKGKSTTAYRYWLVVFYDHQEDGGTCKVAPMAPDGKFGKGSREGRVRWKVLPASQAKELIVVEEACTIVPSHAVNKVSDIDRETWDIMGDATEEGMEAEENVEEEEKRKKDKEEVQEENELEEEEEEARQEEEQRKCANCKRLHQSIKYCREMKGHTAPNWNAS